MAGRMGVERVTVQNLTVHAVDTERGLILIKGAVPGPKGGLVVAAQRRQEGRHGMSESPSTSSTSKGAKSGTVELPAELFDVRSTSR